MRLATSSLAIVLVACGLGTVGSAAVVGPPAIDAGADDASVDAPNEAAGEPPGVPTAVTATPIAVASTVSTLAGSVEGFADGTGKDAQFDFPVDVAVDDAGNVFVADRQNYRVRKITPAGVVSTLAGSGGCAFADASGTDAGFCGLSGITLDAAGNVYVTDKYNYRVRKITPAGVVSTFAGSGVPGATDATGTDAQFTAPVGLASDAAGNLYVTDLGVTYDTSRIRKITSAGVVTTLAGQDAVGLADGTGASALFNYPAGIASTPDGTLYVADEHNHAIRKVTPAGVVTTIAGNGTSGYVEGPGADARFYNPTGIEVDAAGNVFVGDYYNGVVRRITAAGVVSTLAGDATVEGSSDGPGPMASFTYPFGVSLHAPTGSLFVAEYFGHHVRKIAIEGAGALEVAFSAPASSGSSPITGFVASASAPGRPTRTCAIATATRCTIRGLASGVVYAVSVVATNGAGPGAPSPATTATPD